MSQAEDIVTGLGGPTNILEVEACITRLRTQVRDITLIDEPILRNAGAHGIMRRGPIIQVVLGPGANNVANDIGQMLVSGQ
jgi:PTS system N-acetylglucosamine-specific IIB component